MLKLSFLVCQTNVRHVPTPLCTFSEIKCVFVHLFTAFYPGANQACLADFASETMGNILLRQLLVLIRVRVSLRRWKISLNAQICTSILTVIFPASHGFSMKRSRMTMKSILPNFLPNIFYNGNREALHKSVSTTAHDFVSIMFADASQWSDKGANCWN